MAIEVYRKKRISVSTPTKNSGYAIYKLIERCQPLDLNSSYLYFIQSHYFQKTCALATCSNDVIGFVSGFMDPLKENTLFVWQVAIDEPFRGHGLAQTLINYILQQNLNTEFIETSITEDNLASQKLFSKLSKHLNTVITQEKFLDQQTHFLKQHESEYLFRIGPFTLPKE